MVSDSPQFPGQLVFQTEAPQEFFETYSDWISRFGVLSELFMLTDFTKQLENDGWQVVFADSCKKILADHDRWNRPITIGNFVVPGGGELFGYQSFSLHRALERSGTRSRAGRFFFVGWGTGTGKTIFACAGAQELANRGEIDVVLAFTCKSLRSGLHKAFTESTALNAVIVDGDKEKRQKMYGEGSQVFTLNYEKANFDQAELKRLVRGKRVLFVLDEVQKVLTADKKNKARKGIDNLIKACHSTVWPMSASVVKENPLRYRDVFNLAGAQGNPLGTVEAFESAYAASKRPLEITTKWGGRIKVGWSYNWDYAKLHEVRHLVSDRTQSARKTDPSVRENFKGLQTIVVPVDMSAADRGLYDKIAEAAAAARGRREPIEPYYRLLRYVCNTPQALARSESPLAAEFVQRYPNRINSIACAKLEMLCDQVESIRDAGDKVVVFTQWTHLSLFFLSAALRARGISLVEHYGTGMNATQQTAAISQFKNDPDCTVLLSSDAGAYGLNLQEARYVINYECPYSYDTLMQRSNRIDRADSWLDGLTSYIYMTPGTVEERILEINDTRRKLAANTLGTNEVLTYGNENSVETLEFLLFGG